MPGEEAYCVKCKAKREMKDPHNEVIKNKNGKNPRNVLKGICNKCDTKMVKFVKA